MPQVKKELLFMRFNAIEVLVNGNSAAFAIMLAPGVYIAQYPDGTWLPQSGAQYKVWHNIFKQYAHKFSGESGNE